MEARFMLRTVARKIARLPGFCLVARKLRAWRNRQLFRREFDHFQSASTNSVTRFPIRWEDRKPFLSDRVGTSGFDRHYFFHQAWAARVLAETKPLYHVDISSHVEFNAIVSAFIPVKFYDFHPVRTEISNLQTGRADLTHLQFQDNSIPSLSCLHVIEHIGLGRYGDKLDPNGDLTALHELVRVLAPGGQLLLALPVGRPRVVFNAHRIYSYELVIEALTGLQLKEFALIPDSSDAGDLIRHASPALVMKQNYACGCFLAVKNPLLLRAGFPPPFPR